ncbi:MAG TPA: GNAT family N-acetyltransferase [Ignavibacteria bacterium]|mgnify:CR=1 FL=1|nr:GNAT family N-acetyltransferase [Ignavibacteria bacterium]
MNIILKDITKENYREAVKLKLTEEHAEFVAPNVFSIAQSKFYSSWKPTAIYNDEEMIGFLMYGEDDVNEGDGSIWIIRLMIVEEHQRKGYGREAMLKLIETIKNNYENKEIFISFVPENSSAMNLYESIGFEDTGRIEEGEKVYCLKIK